MPPLGQFVPLHLNRVMARRNKIFRGSISELNVQLNELLEQAVALHQAGNFVAAAKLYRRIVDRVPGHAHSRHLLGLVLHSLGQSADGIELIRKAIELNPRDAVFHSNLALIFEALGRFEDAEKACRNAIEIDAGQPDTHYKLGAVLLRQGMGGDAITSFNRAISLRSGYFEARYNLGIALNAGGKTDEAIKQLEAAVALRPESANAHHTLGISYQAAGSVEKAMQCYKQAIALSPQSIPAFNSLAVLLKQSGDIEQAVRVFEAALRFAPESVMLHLNLGLALCARGQLEDGGEHLQKAVLLDTTSTKAHYNLGVNLLARDRLEMAVPQFEAAIALKFDYADAHNNLGTTLDARNLSEKAIEHYELALRFDPTITEAYYNLAMSQLRIGDWKNGWVNYEWRWKSQKSSLIQRSFQQPQWMGGPLDGCRILLHAEQGLGDTIQFLRFVPLLQTRGALVILEVQDRLQRIALEIPGLMGVFRHGDPLPEFDYHCPLLSLPLAFGIGPEMVPKIAPYLIVPEEARRMAASLELPQERPKVGIVWAGNQTFTNDRYRYRSIRLEQFRPLFALRSYQFYSLQHGEARSELGGLKGCVQELALPASDMAETAAQIELLDLVISVDTSVAHVAASLGVPTFILLPYCSDWRWFQEGERSPWYPAVRLFRQTLPGEWASVIEEVRSSLSGLLPALPDTQ